jgi:hypothetical protein
VKRAAAMLLTATLGACGYTVGTGLAERGIETVAFQVVGNESYRQRFEVEISRFLARELPVTTDLQLATRAEADAVLQVVLNEARERTAVIGVRDRQNPGAIDYPRTREGVLLGAVTVRLIGRDGTVHIDRQLRDRTEFRSPLGENLTSARAEMAEDLARKIALALESDF